jgi:predicted alpha/beta-hydrolase family hydrolase
MPLPLDEIPLHIESGATRVSALLLLPNPASALLVLGHGAGAGMTHPFLTAIARGLAERAVATLRYQFPYMEAGGGRPDRGPVLEETTRAAVERAAREGAGLPLYAGGKSMGGRISAQATAKGLLGNLKGLVFYGFPLHAAKQPSTSRARCLAEIAAPMLFLQGTRDALAEIGLVREVLAPRERAELVEIEGADHSFHVLKRSGRTDAQVLTQLLDLSAAFMLRHATP